MTISSPTSVLLPVARIPATYQVSSIVSRRLRSESRCWIAASRPRNGPSDSTSAVGSTPGVITSYSFAAAANTGTVRALAFTKTGKDWKQTAPKEADAKALERGQLRMDPERHTCTWKNEPVTLTVTEFLILQALATRPGVVKSRNALMDAAYDDQVYVDDRTIDSHIKRLRKKFKLVDDDFEMIETLYGVGYRFKEA